MNKHIEIKDIKNILYKEKNKDKIFMLKMRNTMNIFEITNEEIQALNGDQFEELIIVFYQTFGFTAIKTPKTNDYGADVIVESPIGKISVQCKRQTSNVGIKAIQEVYASMMKYNSVASVVISSSDFTNSAIELAKCCNVELINGEQLWKRITEIQNNEVAIKHNKNLKEEMNKFLEDKHNYDEFMNNCEQQMNLIREKLIEIDEQKNSIISISHDAGKYYHMISNLYEKIHTMMNSIDNKKEDNKWNILSVLNFIISIAIIIYLL